MQIETNTYQDSLFYNNTADKSSIHAKIGNCTKTLNQDQVLEITNEQKLGSSIEVPLPSANYSPLPNNNGAPYSFLANKYGMIEYDGVVYQCDDANRTICLGDMSKQGNILTIPLEGGGSLCVNRDNIDELSRSISMFSAKDQGRILRALSTDAKVQSVKNEIEDEKSKLYNAPQEA